MAKKKAKQKDANHTIRPIKFKERLTGSFKVCLAIIAALIQIARYARQVLDRTIEKTRRIVNLIERLSLNCLSGVDCLCAN